ncbi:MAG: hypothetical protein EA392_07275 [Cryomorphaceae bacterium]|nr:MAG: hypothetical protein EA392_07275 [Cryomorphaceae bacterium]
MLEEEKDTSAEKISVEKRSPEGFDSPVVGLDEALHEVVSELKEVNEVFVNSALGSVSEHWRGIVSSMGELLLVYCSEYDTLTTKELSERSKVFLNKLQQEALREATEPLEQQEEALGQGIQIWLDQVKQLPGKHEKVFQRALQIADLAVHPDDSARIRKAKTRLKFWRRLGGAKRTHVALHELLAVWTDTFLLPGFQRLMGEWVQNNYQLAEKTQMLVKKHLIERPLVSQNNGNQNELQSVFSKLKDEAECMHKRFGEKLSALVDSMAKELARAACDVDINGLIRARRIDFTGKTQSALLNRLRHFPEAWAQNQKLFLQHMEGGLWFQLVLANILSVLQRSEATVRSQYFKAVRDNINVFFDGIEHLRKEANKDIGEEETVFKLNERLFLNPQLLIQRVESGSDEATAMLPESCTLLNTGKEWSGATFTKRLPQKDIVIARIADYLIDTTLVEPYRKEIQDITSKLNRINGKVVNTANLISYSFDSEPKAEGEDWKSVLEQSEQTAQEAREELEKTEKAFGAMLLDMRLQLLGVLQTETVLERAAQLTIQSDKDKSSPLLYQWLGKRFSRVSALKDEFLQFISRRQYEAVVARYERKYQELDNDTARMLDFLDTLKLPPHIDSDLPYYYKQLFGGRHLNTGSAIHVRNREMVVARSAVQRMKGGSGGALIVTGDSLSGKTFLIEHIAGNLIKGKIIRIEPPQGGSHSASDLFAQIGKALGNPKGTLRSILTSVQEGTVFIFNDIEQWWLRAEGGGEALLALEKLIVRFGHRHFFLLSAGNEGFRMISSQITLGEHLVGTIVIKPASFEETRDAIWKRHETGGLLLENEQKQAEGLKSRKMEKLVKKLYRRSEGNVGLALRYWVRSVNQVSKGAIWVSDPGNMSIPDIRNANWKALLYNLYLHRSLSLERMVMLFNLEGETWVRHQLNTMKRATLVVEVSKDVFEINRALRPYLEQYLREIKLIP